MIILLRVFSLIVVTTLVSKGQTYDWTKLGTLTTEVFPIHVGELSTIELPSKIDTIKSYLLVTMEIPECSGDCRMIKTIIGYEIIERKGYEIKWFYLNESKKPISKSIIVWMSKSINP